MKIKNLHFALIVFSTFSFQLLIFKSQAQVCFSPATNFSVGASLISLSSSDFNGDGKADVASANNGSNIISVRLGNGAGNFGSATDFIAGDAVHSIISKDFNGDGKVDLATANFNSNNVSILLGDGLGSFGAAVNYAAGTNPSSIISADFNGDSNNDLAIANNGSQNVSVLLGNGLGGFGAAASFTIGNNPSSVTSSDFNGDGFLDLAITNYGSNNISVLLGDGAGNFGLATNFSVGSNPSSVVSADFNGDSNIDLAISNYSSNNISVLLGNGLGTFGAATNFLVGTNPSTITNADFNGDGKVDLATANYNSNNVSVLLGNGLGSFGAAINFAAGSNPLPIINADFNGDGKADLVTANSGSNNISILLNNPLIVTANASATIVCAGASVTLTGGGASSYTWTGGVTDAVAFSAPSSTATYTVTGTTGECTNIATKTISINPLPVSNAGNDLTICSGIAGSIGATAVAGYSYSWSPGTGLSAATISNPDNTTVNTGSTPIVTTYTLTTTISSTGCQSTDNSVITVNPQPVLAITNPVAVCASNTVDITTNFVTAGSTGGGTLSYWVNASATSPLQSPNAIASNGTNYIKVIATGGCTDIKPVAATINPLPVSDAGNDLTVCSGMVGSIGVAAIAGNTYSWSPGTGLNDGTVSNPDNTTLNTGSIPIVTTYTVTTTSTSTGCQSTDISVITVNPQPVLMITSPVATCFPNSVDITAAAITAGSTGGGSLSYWVDAGATSSQSLPNAVSASGTNYIKVTATGGCEDIKPVNIMVNPLPVSDAGIDLTICSGTAGSIGVPPISGNTYSWSPGTGLNDATVSNPDNTTLNTGSAPISTSYTVTTTNAATGCQSTDIAAITVNPQPVLTITSPASECFPNTVDITADAVTAGSIGSGSLSYWNNAAATDTLSSANVIAASGTNYIKVTAAGGCSDIQPVIVTINPQPTATFTIQNESSSLYCDGSIMAHLTGGTGTIQAQWLNSNHTVISTTDSAGMLCHGFYSLHLIDSNLCTNAYSQVIQGGAIPPTPPICMVTVDSTLSHNLLIWEKTNLNMAAIDSFVVYREANSNIYQRIGAVSKSALSSFDDFSADPAVKGYRYKLRCKNIHGALSLLSAYNNSIYLSNVGADFSWTPYLVENSQGYVSSYNVLRDDNSTGNFQIIGNTSVNQLAYTDANFASYPNAQYYVEALLTAGSCQPTRSGFSGSRSNVKHFGISGIQQLNDHQVISIYPNPAGNTLNVTGITSKTMLRLYNIVGELVLEKEVDNNIAINTSQLNEGIYTLLMESKINRSFNKVLISH